MDKKFGWSYRKLKVLDASLGNIETMKKPGQLFEPPKRPETPPLPKLVDGTDKSRVGGIEEKVAGFKQKIKEIKKAALDSMKKSEGAATPEKKKYVHVSQDWNATYQRGHNKVANPVTSRGKRSPSHVSELDELAQYHGTPQHTFSDSPKAPWGHESYEVKGDGSLKYVKANYDTSG